MNERSQDLFTVTLVDRYDDNWQQRESYKYSFFCNELIDMDDAALEMFIETTVKSLKDQRNMIASLKNTSIDSIKDELHPKIYGLLQHANVKNLYTLRRNLRRKYNGEIVSGIPGIGTVKGVEILDVLDKHNIPSNFYTARWQ